MRAYTYISQSKKLAEILAIESADMFYYKDAVTKEDENEWEVCVQDYNNDEYIEITADNPVDACYEMIIKLHEQKLL